jgi:hypothetical protein
VPPRREPELSESQARRASALKSTLGPLASFRATGLPLDFEGALCPPPYPRGRELAIERERDAVPSGGSVGPKAELNRRRYDWSPPIENGPRETQVERRLREWREAQAAIDRRQRAAREVQPPAPPASQPASVPRDPGQQIPERPPVDRGATVASSAKSELGRRRYDWTPAPPDLDALIRGPGGPSGGRER